MLIDRVHSAVTSEDGTKGWLNQVLEYEVRVLNREGPATVTVRRSVHRVGDSSEYITQEVGDIHPPYIHVSWAVIRKVIEYRDEHGFSYDMISEMMGRIWHVKVSRVTAYDWYKKFQGKKLPEGII